MNSFTEEANGLLALQLYGRDECRSIVDTVKYLNGWRDATVRVRGNEKMHDSVAREVRSASVLPLACAPAIFDQFEEKMAKVIKPQIGNFWGVDLKEHSGMQIVHYKPGGRYLAHQDAGQDFQNRYFTVICYLNNGFEGGRTQFPKLHHATIPEAGKAIIFPAKFFHGAEPVIAGEKYVLVAWVLGPVPIKWI